VSDGASGSFQFNFAPTYAVAQTSLSQASNGLGLVGISQYVTRSTPSGPDNPPHNFPFATPSVVTYGYPAVAAVSKMTSVTASFLIGGGGDQMTVTLLVFLFD
jgi:hypothetical protein